VLDLLVGMMARDGERSLPASLARRAGDERS
jgi:hypothetical protein